MTSQSFFYVPVHLMYKANQVLTGITILVIDDDNLFIRMMEAVCTCNPLFEDVHYLYCKNPKEAFKIILNHTVELLVVDLHMESMSGYEVIRCIRDELHIPIPIMFCTTESDVTVYTQAFQAGCNNIISKPVNKDLFWAKAHYLASVHRQDQCGTLLNDNGKILTGGYFENIVLDWEMFQRRYDRIDLSVIMFESDTPLDGDLSKDISAFCRHNRNPIRDFDLVCWYPDLHRCGLMLHTTIEGALIVIQRLAKNLTDKYPATFSFSLASSRMTSGMVGSCQYGLEAIQRRGLTAALNLGGRTYALADLDIGAVVAEHV